MITPGLQQAMNEYDQAVKEWGRVANSIMDGWEYGDNDASDPTNQDWE